MRITIICLGNAFKSFLAGSIPTKNRKLICKKKLYYIFYICKWNGTPRTLNNSTSKSTPIVAL